MLEGEDAAAYDELQGRIWAAVKPTDIIDEIFVADFANLQWDVMRLRRMKTSVIRSRGLAELESWLGDKLDDDRYSDQFVEQLGNTLQQHLSEDRAQTLAAEFVRNDQKAIDEVIGVLDASEVDLDDVYRAARENEAAELVQKYAASRPDADSEIREIFAKAAQSMDDMWSDAFANTEFLLAIERIDR